MPKCYNCHQEFEWGSEKGLKLDPRTGYEHQCPPTMEECYGDSFYNDCIHKEIHDCNILPRPEQQSLIGGAYYVCKGYIPKQRTLLHFQKRIEK